MGIAHRALDYKEWFIKAVTVVNNFFGIYVDPIAWVNRHRLHHKNADHDGDPNKLSGDGFWRTLYLCVMPYRCNDNLATDPILQSRTFRVVANPLFAIVAQTISFYLLWKLVGDLKFAAGDVGRDANFRAVGQHDSKLLDPHPDVRLPALSR